MPAKGRKQHTHIHPGRCYSAYFLMVYVWKFYNRGCGFIEIVQVKMALDIVEVFVWAFRILKQGKARAESIDW